MSDIFQILLSALGGAILSGGVTVWYKNKEIRLKNEEITELRRNNDREDIKFGQSKIDHFLEFALNKGINENKVNAFRKFSNILTIIDNDIIFGERLFDEHESDLAMSIAKSLDHIIYQSQLLIDNYPNVYTKIWTNLAIYRNNAIKIKSDIEDLMDDGPKYEEAVINFSSDLLELHGNLKQLLDKMESEFKELENMREEYLKS